jgi:hypothetical protein
MKLTTHLSLGLKLRIHGAAPTFPDIFVASYAQVTFFTARYANQFPVFYFTFSSFNILCRNFMPTLMDHLVLQP